MEKKSLEIAAEVLHGMAALPVRLSVHPPAGGKLSFEGWKEVSAREISIRVRSSLETVSVRLDAGDALRVHIDRDDYGGPELDLCAAAALAAYAGRFDPAKLEGVALASQNRAEAEQAGGIRVETPASLSALPSAESSNPKRSGWRSKAELRKAIGS